MRIILQRASRASVTVDEQIVGCIGKGYVVLLGIGKDDSRDKVDKMVEKIRKLRIFPDENDKINLSVEDVRGEILVVSQFTLYADCKKGNRPSFTDAGSPQLGLYEVALCIYAHQVKVLTVVYIPEGLRMRTVNRLRHGGIMANYQCTAACRHCLYACSPERTGGYISKETAEEICALLREGGCRSVHIGGGEHFLDFDGMTELVHTVSKAGITVDYIETNAYWATDERQIENRLRVLARAGADTLCISVDPFHAEYVPVKRPLFLTEICRRSDFGYFLWQDRFLPVLSRVDSGITHSRAELERLISPEYILETACSYGVNMGGRAVNIEAEYTVSKNVASVVDSNPCDGLLSGGHFHADLYGRYIPPGCTGIAIPLKEAVRGIPDGKYPAFEALLLGGTAGLLQYAQALGFNADNEYPLKCALCFHIRRWLCKNAPSPELDAEHYTESLK